jgi:hypothetical protein
MVTDVAECPARPTYRVNNMIPIDGFQLYNIDLDIIGVLQPRVIPNCPEAQSRLGFMNFSIYWPRSSCWFKQKAGYDACNVLILVTYTGEYFFP